MSSSVGSLTRHTHTHTHTDIRTSCNSSFFFCFFFLSTRHEKHALTNTRTQTLDDPQHPPTSAKKKFCPYTSTGLCYASYKRLGSPIQTGKDVQNGFDRVELTPKSLTERRKVTNKQIGNIWDRIIDENEGPFWERKQK